MIGAIAAHQRHSNKKKHPSQANSSRKVRRAAVFFGRGEEHTQCHRYCKIITNKQSKKQINTIKYTEKGKRTGELETIIPEIKQYKILLKINKNTGPEHRTPKASDTHTHPSQPQDADRGRKGGEAKRTTHTNRRKAVRDRPNAF